jgi:hypothetical protein
MACHQCVHGTLHISDTSKQSEDVLTTSSANEGITSHSKNLAADHLPNTLPFNSVDRASVQRKFRLMQNWNRKTMKLK